MSYLAIDLGAGSGRAMLVRIAGNRIAVEEAYRFVSKPAMLGGTMYWDFLNIFEHIKEAIRSACRMDSDLQSIAVDTWGVDFGVVDKNGSLLANPVCYRDPRTAGAAARSASAIPSNYLRTGIQQMDINTLYQLFVMRENNSCILREAAKILLMPDLINFFLTGNAACEYTIASTTQMLDAVSKDWDATTLSALGIVPSLLQPVIPSGTFVGELRADVAAEIGTQLKVYTAPSHDTASAIAAIPMSEDAAFLSSGTWSLLGTILDEPILTQQACKLGFTNEGGVEGKILFMKNLTGLWLLQRLIAEWEQHGDSPYDYDYLLRECALAAPRRSIVNPDDAMFTNPPSMRAAIQDYCRKTAQHLPSTKGELVRCVLESLAMKYREVMVDLQKVTGKTFRKIYVVGGGSKNDMLNQFIADELRMDVIVGITEASACGNALQQAISAGQLTTWCEAREAVGKSFMALSYTPI